MISRTSALSACWAHAVPAVFREIHDGYPLATSCSRPISAIAIPPRTSPVATIRRGEIVSPRNATPPAAAMTGTGNWTTARERPTGRGVPRTRRRSRVPGDRARHGREHDPARFGMKPREATILTTSVIGNAFTKLLVSLRQRIRGAPPAQRIDTPGNAGRDHHDRADQVRRGQARQRQIHQSRRGAHEPHPLQRCGRVPEITATISIVTCTDPNSSSAPVPVVRLT